jgi:hypothetical protein
MNLSSIAFSQEPALWVAIADALIILAITFGAPITPEQKGAIDALLTCVAGVVIRSQVSPVGAAAAPPTKPLDTLPPVMVLTPPPPPPA